jgi:hypothetical protein
LGCYADIVDGSTRDLNGLGANINTVGGGTVESCLIVCSALGFIYAGVQSGFKQKKKHVSLFDFKFDYLIIKTPQ